MAQNRYELVFNNVKNGVSNDLREKISQSENNLWVSLMECVKFPDLEHRESMRRRLGEFYRIMTDMLWAIEELESKVMRK